MKNFTLFKMLLIFSVFFSYYANAQNDATTFIAKFITAQKYSKGDGLPKNMEKAIKLYTDCAENGNLSAAMIQLGIIYKTGSGVDKDAKKAFYWFSKSANKTDPIGMYYLGTMYKTGIGVNLDYNKAYEYFRASAEKGFSGGIYNAGYCKFKGLGTVQDYKEAVNWFQNGDKQENIACTFMLGICYKNGYGVNIDAEKAKQLLKKAAERKIPNAENELTQEKSEIENNLSDKNKDEKNILPIRFRELQKKQYNISLEGKWTGMRYFYDWSQQHVIGEDSLVINIKISKDSLTGEWIEKGQKVVDIKGIIEKGQIIFNNTEFTGTNRWNEKNKIQFNIGYFSPINEDTSSLIGKIESYSPESKEPGYPCYIMISRTPNNSTTNNINVGNQLKNKDLNSKNTSSLLSVTPNPFSEEIKITYIVSQNNNVSLSIYNITGTLIAQKTLGEKSPDTYSETIKATVLPGQYLLKLTIGSEVFTRSIIKK